MAEPKVPTEIPIDREQIARMRTGLRVTLPSDVVEDVISTLNAFEATVKRLLQENAELLDGWRQGLLQKKINILPETEAAVHIAELQEENAALRARVEKLEAKLPRRIPDGEVVEPDDVPPLV